MVQDPTTFYTKQYYETHQYVFVEQNRSDYKRIMEFLRFQKDDAVLDLGCGLGVLLEKIPSVQKVGIETNDFAVEECKKRGLHVIKADADQGLPFGDASFNIVTMIEVLAHVKNPDFVLDECSRVLLPGGKICITAPIHSVFFHNASPTHLSELTIRELRSLLQRHGFSVLSHEVCGLSFLNPLLENFLFRPFRLLKKIFVRKTKSNKGVRLIDSCRKISDKTFLKPLTFYRKHFLRFGVNQMIFAEKH